MSRHSDTEELEARKRASVGQLLLRTARRFNERALARLRTRHPDLRPAHVQLFAYLDADGTRQTELARRAGISKQAVGQLVTDLIDAGVLARVADPSDRRAHRVRLTRRGERTVAEGLTVLEQIERELAAELGTALLARLRRDLTRLDRGLG